MSVKTAAYIRVSTAEQAREGISLEAQEERIRAYCSMSGLDLVTIAREEGVSANLALADRPAGRHLMDLMAAGEIQNVVALKLDRLFRDTIDALTLTRAWDQARMAMHLVDMGGQPLNTGSAMGRLFITIMAAFAELERNLIGERTAAAMQHLKAQGRHLGAPPLGRAMVRGVLVEVTDQMATRRRMEELRSENLTYQQIADTLTAEGHKTKRGGAWYASTVSRALKRNV